MSDYSVAAVLRAGAYSPNHIGNDASILHAVADQLGKRGCNITLYSEEQFQDSQIEAEVVLDMCREPESVAKLCRLEDEGKLVVNSGYGIDNCTRERMTRLLLANGVPYPESLIVNTNENVSRQLKKIGMEQCWVKRGDYHAQHKEDVTYCRHAEEVQETIHEFFFRNIPRVVINRHLEGDLVKFYGLEDGSFFYWFYPLERHHSKFGDELVNGVPSHCSFDAEDLKQKTILAAKAIGVKIYGGDCIIDQDGNFQIIDFNDWPSFAPCRKEAAPAIARFVLRLIKERKIKEIKEIKGESGKRFKSKRNER